jgi:hypothetical protein
MIFSNILFQGSKFKVLFTWFKPDFVQVSLLALSRVKICEGLDGDLKFSGFMDVICR